MSFDQIVLLTILLATLAMFTWERWRYDIVALGALVACVVAGLVPPDKAFQGFGHAAVITVAAVLAISRVLSDSGIVSLITRHLLQFAGTEWRQISVLCVVATVISGFMNNVGALALLLPVAMSMAQQQNYPHSRILMPLAFASILGGLTTLIGTPPNIIVSNVRADSGLGSYAMFDFAPIGVVAAAVGVALVVFAARRVVPVREGNGENKTLFEVSDYLTELRVKNGSAVVGLNRHELDDRIGDDGTVLGVIPEGVGAAVRSSKRAISAGDILLVQGSTETFAKLVDAHDLAIVPRNQLQEDLSASDLSTMEAVIRPRARLVGHSPRDMRLRTRHGINLLAVTRDGRPYKQRLKNVKFREGDILLIEGEADALEGRAIQLGCLPLAGKDEKSLLETGINLGPALVFAIAIATTAAGLFPPEISFTAALLAMTLLRQTTFSTIYDAVDWPIIVLLAAMIPVGGALQTTGTTGVIAAGIDELLGDVHPSIVLAILMAVTMSLSAIMNNAATAVIMAPLAIDIAQRADMNADPFLMGVAVAASSTFFTPISHQNNALVMGPGGYRFVDYVRLGLPLSALIMAVAIPLIPIIWPY